MQQTQFHSSTEPHDNMAADFLATWAVSILVGSLLVILYSEHSVPLQEGLNKFLIW